MSIRRVLSRITSWAVLSYAALSLSVGLWLLMKTRWPLVASDRPIEFVMASLCAANVLLAALCVPSKGGGTSFWPGLFSLRRESVRAIRRVIQLTTAAIWVDVAALAIRQYVSRRPLSPPAVQNMLLAVAVFMLVRLPLLLGALAAGGHSAIHTPPPERRKGWFARDVAD